MSRKPDGDGLQSRQTSKSNTESETTCIVAKNAELGMQKTQNVNRFICKLCNKGYIHKCVMKDKTSTSINGEPYVCQTCGKRIHRTEQWHKCSTLSRWCPLCGIKFSHSCTSRISPRHSSVAYHIVETPNKQQKTQEPTPDRQKPKQHVVFNSTVCWANRKKNEDPALQDVKISEVRTIAASEQSVIEKCESRDDAGMSTAVYSDAAGVKGETSNQSEPASISTVLYDSSEAISNCNVISEVADNQQQPDDCNDKVLTSLQTIKCEPDDADEPLLSLDGRDVVRSSGELEPVNDHELPAVKPETNDNWHLSVVKLELESSEQQVDVEQESINISDRMKQAAELLDKEERFRVKLESADNLKQADDKTDQTCTAETEPADALLQVLNHKLADTGDKHESADKTETAVRAKGCSTRSSTLDAQKPGVSTAHTHIIIKQGDDDDETMDVDDSDKTKLNTPLLDQNLDQPQDQEMNRSGQHFVHLREITSDNGISSTSAIVPTDEDGLQCRQNFTYNTELATTCIIARNVELGKHINQKVTNFVCNLCSKEYTHKCVVKDRISTYISGKLYMCQTCGNGINPDDEWHKCSNPVYKCVLCGICFSHSCTAQAQAQGFSGACSIEEAPSNQVTQTSILDEQKPKIHVVHSSDSTTCIDPYPFTCETCGKSFHYPSELKRHTLTHSSTKPYLCNVCGKRFCTLAYLKDHAHTHTDKTPYVCELCDKRFSAKACLEAHAYTHTKKICYTCDVCGKGFYYKGSLKRHAYMHTQDKPFLCTICGKKFNEKYRLETHIRIHTGERPYECKVCCKSFKSLPNLREHQLIHAKQMPFNCDLCGKGFKRRSYFEQHTCLYQEEKQSKKAS